MSIDRVRRDLVRNAILVAGLCPAAMRLAASAAGSSARSARRRGPEPVDFAQVRFTDAFWRPKQQIVSTVTMQACIVQTEQKSGRIRNFEKAARRQAEAFEGTFYDDSDVYKALEAIAYSLKIRPDVELERKADGWIDTIARAQQPDGYLNTYFTLTGLEKRWTDIGLHEDYCAGHLIEAAIAYYQSTGKRKLLEVARRFADHIDSTLRLPDRHWISGHEEIELALMKLYRLTDETRYLDLAQWYLSQRGRGYGHSLALGEPDPTYWQDQVPVKDQRHIVGHAVRAMYLYCGATDVVAATGDEQYLEALRAVWDDVVGRKLYVTGGIGSAMYQEGMAPEFDLPNSQAYCETCASCGMVFWNHRMGLLTGEGRYFDVLERSLYNGALAGLSLSGDRFFYANPLASSAATPSELFGLGRREWFGTACCPANIARLVTSLGGYVYAQSDEGIWINLFVASTANCRVKRFGVVLAVETQYPWEGRIRVSIDPERADHWTLRLRVPGWANGTAVPGELYRFENASLGPIGLRLNGEELPIREEKGYAVIERRWQRGDVVELELPMNVERVVARNEVQADRNRVAIERGPLVYCVEGADNRGEAWDLIASAAGELNTMPRHVLQESVVSIQGQAQSIVSRADGEGVLQEGRSFTAIPYYAWANRDNYEMQVWLPTEVHTIKING
jgi:uncharacterized protein